MANNLFFIRFYNVAFTLCFTLGMACSCTSTPPSPPNIPDPAIIGSADQSTHPLDSVYQSVPDVPLRHPYSSPQAPRPISSNDLQQDKQTLRYTFDDKSEELPDGFFRIDYQRTIRSYDITFDYSFISKTGYFNYGLMHGPWQVEFIEPNIGLNYTETYKNGLMNGPLIVYNADKTIHYQTVIKDGNGRWKLFYATGKVEVEGDYRNGREQGTWIRYKPDGEVELQLVYDKGVLIRTIYGK